MAGTTRLELATSAVTVSGSQALATTYKSTDGILSHCKTVLDIAIVYLGVYHGQKRIVRPVHWFGLIGNFVEHAPDLTPGLPHDSRGGRNRVLLSFRVG